MKLKFFALFVVLFALGTAALAQSSPNPAELKAFLNLSDTQVQSLIMIRQQLPQAVQPVAQMAGQKQQALQQLLQSNAPDPAAVGRLVIELTNLSQQVQKIFKSAQDQSLAVLEPDQAQKLQVLAQAIQLQTPAGQAVALGLLNPPNPPQQDKLMPSFPGDRANR